MPCPNLLCLGPRTVYYLLKIAGIFGAISAGIYTCNKLMYDYQNIRWSIIDFYETLFSLFIVSAELEQLEHPALKKFGLFLTTYIGRAIFYIFMGGLLLDGSWGMVPGIWLLVCGVINIMALCACKEQLDKTKADIAFEKAAAAKPVPVTI